MLVKYKTILPSAETFLRGVDNAKMSRADKQGKQLKISKTQIFKNQLKIEERKIKKIENLTVNFQLNSF